MLQVSQQRDSNVNSLHTDQTGRGAEPSDVDRLLAVGALIWSDQARVLAAANLRRQDGGAVVVECGLRGGSMASAIPAGSRIRICCEPGPFRVGDVVAFLNEGRMVVHRVVHRSGRGVRAWLVTRGDAMVLWDPPIIEAAALGRVISFDAGSGWNEVGLPSWRPRRDRLLAFVVLCAGALLLRFSADSARRLAGWLQLTERRLAWVKSRFH